MNVKLRIRGIERKLRKYLYNGGDCVIDMFSSKIEDRSSKFTEFFQQLFPSHFLSAHLPGHVCVSPFPIFESGGNKKMKLEHNNTQCCFHAKSFHAKTFLGVVFKRWAFESQLSLVIFGSRQITILW